MAFNELTFGAQLAAAGDMLGMSRDETLEYIERKIQLNNQKRARRGEAPIDGRQGINAFLARIGKVEGLNNEMPEYTDDRRTVDNKVLDADDRSELQQFGGLDDQGNIKNVDEQLKERERAAGKKDPNELIRYYFDKNAGERRSESIYIPDGMPVPTRFRDAAMARDFGVYQTDVAAPAQQVMREELGRLQQGIDQFGSEAFGSVPEPQRENPRQITAASVAGALEEQLADGRAADSSIGREAVRRSAENFDPEVREFNDNRADAEAQRIARERFVLGGGGAQADAALERIGNIQGLGKAGELHKIQVSRPQISTDESLNAPVTDNSFAGPLQKQEQWLVNHAPGYREGKVFGDFPQVAIGDQLRGAEEAIAAIKLGRQGIDLGELQINNLNDLQVAANRVVALGDAQGVRFFDRVDGQNVYNDNPGIEQVLNKARMNPGQQDALARALFQIEAGRRQGANRAAKEANIAGMPGTGVKVAGGAQHADLGGGQIGVARINREKIEGREVKAALQQLDGRQGNPGEPLDRQELRQARMPDQAAPAGQKPPRANFIRGDVRAMPRAERAARMGTENAAAANRVEDRFLSAERERRDNASIPNVRGRLVAENPNFGIGRNEFELAQGATSSVVNPSPQPEQAIRRIDNDIRNQLAELNSAGKPPQGPGRRGTFMGTPDGPNDQPRRDRFIDNIVGGVRNAPKNFRRARPAYQAAAATGGALLGAVGLDALITDETERRGSREEVMY